MDRFASLVKSFVVGKYIQKVQKTEIEEFCEDLDDIKYDKLKESLKDLVKSSKYTKKLNDKLEKLKEEILQDANCGILENIINKSENSSDDKKPKKVNKTKKIVKKIVINKQNDSDSSTDAKKSQILVPCEVPDFVNIKILKEYVKKNINGNKEYFDDLDITYKISDPKKAEWILSKSIKNSKLFGNGNTNVDIMINNNIGIDVSVLTLNGNYTNEKSIMQNFSNCNDLDTLFNTNKGENAVEIFREKLIEKCSFKDGNKKDVYYMIFICEKKNVFLSCLKLILENISAMSFSKFTKSYKNILIDNFIDEKNGNVKLYKSKKRLELRLSKDILNNECSIRIF